MHRLIHWRIFLRFSQSWEKSTSKAPWVSRSILITGITGTLGLFLDLTKRARRRPGHGLYLVANGSGKA